MKYNTIIFDFAGTLFTSISQLAPGAKELLDYCQARGLNMGAVTAGTYDETVIQHLGLDKYMKKIEVVSDMGKTPDVFDRVVREIGGTPETSIGIGDQVGKEIRAMNMLGAKTIFVHHGRPQTPSINPDEHPTKSVKDLIEAKQALEELLAEAE